MKSLEGTKQIKLISIEEDDIHREKIQLSSFVACHSSIKAIDHLTDLLNKRKKDKIKLHRTKCTGIISYVIAPILLKDLVKDIGDSYFSIIIDESTDIASYKYLCICIKYHSKTKNKVITDFLGLLKIDKADSQSLYNHVDDFFKKTGLDIKKVIGLGTDGGKNLCGENNSLFTKISEIAPKVQLIKCICHGLNLAASNAAIELASSLDYMLEITYNWFARSPLRQAKYQELWKSLNFEKFRKFVKLADTRWLARYEAVKVIREQYFILKTHFHDLVTELPMKKDDDTKDKDYKARQLDLMFSDESHFLLLVIIEPILYEVNRVSLTFQKDSLDIGCAYNELKDLILLVSSKVLRDHCNDLSVIKEKMKFTINFKNFDQCDLGVSYYNALKKITISYEKKQDLEYKVFNYFKKLLTGLMDRLPNNIKHFKNLRSITPQFCLSQTETVKFKFADLPLVYEFVKEDDLSKVETQYSKLPFIQWKDYLNKDQIDDTYEFWYAVHQFKYSGGEYVFQELAEYSLMLLSLPTSNAVVECAFSIMNTVKTKVRNRMEVELLNAVMRIKISFYVNKICCKSFEPSKAMLSNFNSRVIYPYCYDKKQDDLQKEQETASIDDVLESMEEFEWPCV